MKHVTFFCPASAGIIDIRTESEGNASETVIRCTEGQFQFSKVRQIEDGFEITVVGEWEAAELTSALASVLPHGGQWIDEGLQ